MPRTASGGVSCHCPRTQSRAAPPQRAHRTRPTNGSDAYAGGASTAATKTRCAKLHLNQTILVQSKAHDRSLQQESGTSFVLTCDQRDLEHWPAGNDPVIVVESHPKKDEAWSGPGLDEVDVAIDAVVDAARVKEVPHLEDAALDEVNALFTENGLRGDLLVFRHRALRPRRTGWQPMN